MPSTETFEFIRESRVARLDAKWPEMKIGVADEDQVGVKAEECVCQVDERVRFIPAVGHGYEVDPVEARIAVACTRSWRPAGRPPCARSYPHMWTVGSWCERAAT